MDYTVEARWSKGNGHRWVIIGLEDMDPLTEERCGPDTTLWLIGMNHSCDTVESVCDSIHECLYDLYQVDDRLKDGDTFNVMPARVNKHHSFDSRWGKLSIPAMTFACDGVHVVKVHNCESCGHEFIKDHQAQTVCPKCTGNQRKERQNDRA